MVPRTLRDLRVCECLRGSWLFSGERPHAHMLSICIHSDFAIEICSVHAHTCSLEPCDHVGRRMTKRIRAPAADERNLRTPRVEQFLRGRRAATVVRDFQDARLRGDETRNNLALDDAADITGQQDRDVAIEDLEDHGIVVAHSLPLPVGRRRVKNDYPCGADIERFALASLIHRDTGRGGTREYSLERYVARNRYPLPYRSWPEVVEKRQRAP